MALRALWAVLIVGVATAIALALGIEAIGAGPVLLLAVVLAALLGRVPGIAAGLVGALSYSYFFLPPQQTFTLGKDDEPLAFVTFVAIALLVGSLVSRAAELRRAAEEREAEAVTNLELLERVRLAEHATNEAEREAREAEQRASMDQARASFFSLAGHNLRTPLATIGTAASTLAASDAQLDTEERRELLASLKEETERLARLVARVLELSRLSTGVQMEPEEAEIDGLIQSAVRNLHHQAADCRIDLEVGEGADLVFVDIMMTSEALLNVLENAVRFAPPGTPIELRARRAGDEVVLTVSDHGPGIPPEERGRVFEPFYRASAGRAAGTGTGLGLSIVRAVVTAQGGSVGVTETPGGGATLELHLPCAEPTRDAAPEERP